VSGAARRRVRSAARLALAVLLMLEGLSTGVRTVSTLQSLMVVYPWTVVALALLRATVAIGQFAAGWMLVDDTPFGAWLGRAVLLSSAALLTVELGLRAAPTSVFPSYRWPAVGAYWLYALAGTWFLRSRRSP